MNHSRLVIALLSLWPMVANFSTYASETEPHPLDTFHDHILDFESPTEVRGILRYMDVAEETIWLDWKQRSDTGHSLRLTVNSFPETYSRNSPFESNTIPKTSPALKRDLSLTHYEG